MQERENQPISLLPREQMPANFIYDQAYVHTLLHMEGPQGMFAE